MTADSELARTSYKVHVMIWALVLCHILAACFVKMEAALPSKTLVNYLLNCRPSHLRRQVTLTHTTMRASNLTSLSYYLYFDIIVDS
jgi:hypothetical protein